MGFGEELLTADMPSEVRDITSVFGNTCSYGGTVDYRETNKGDEVRHLQCDGWAEAKCVKEDKHWYCSGTTSFMRMSCLW
jgi:hypothetical protein